MRNARRLWRSLEATPFDRGVRAQWAEYVGEGLPLLDPYLRPEERHAETYPCPSLGGDGCPRGITVHSPEHVVAYCRDRPRSCDDVVLTQDDIVVWRLDHAGIAGHVARLLGFRGSGPSSEADLHRTFRLGVYRPLAGLEYAAFLTFQAEREEFSAVVERLVAREGRAFLLLAPTADLLGGAAGERLRKAGGAALGLDEVLVADEGSGLILARSPDDVLAAFRASVVEEARLSAAKKGMALFETPANATWPRLKIRFSDRHKVSVEVCGAKGLYTYTEMGMKDGRSKNPTVQWKLLETFAEKNGVLTWSSSSASRTLKKRCEDLRKDLRAFFRIPGDPIEYVEKFKGWRTHFSVSL